MWLIWRVSICPSWEFWSWAEAESHSEPARCANCWGYGGNWEWLKGFSVDWDIVSQ
jgi:hypothetical protein